MTRCSKALLSLLLAVSGARATELSSIRADRKFPVGLCPVANPIEFTAIGPEARITVRPRYSASTTTPQSLTYLAVVPSWVYEESAFVDADETCYQAPEPPARTFYSDEAFSFIAPLEEHFGCDHADWDLAFSRIENGALVFGAPSLGPGVSSASVVVTGLEPGETYVVVALWQAFFSDPGAFGNGEGLDWEVDTLETAAVCAEAVEAFPEKLLESRATYAPAVSRDALAWGPDRYGFVYEDRPGTRIEVLVAFLDSSGTRVRTDLRVSSLSNDASSPVITWDPTRSRFVIAWVELVGTATNIWTAAYAADGALVFPPAPETTSGKAGVPDVACDQSGCVVTYEDTKTGTSLIYMKALGGTTESRVSLRAAAASTAAVEAFPIGFAVVWASGDLYGATYSSAQGIGTLTRQLASDTRITTSATAWRPSLAWNGREFGLAWRDTRNGNEEIYASVLSFEGARIVPERRVTNDPASSSYPDITASGPGGYSVGFHDNRTGNFEIYVARLDRWANPWGLPTQLTIDGAFSLYPSIAWDGTDVAVVFRDDRNATQSHYFGKLTCSCPDPDNDGVCGFTDNCPAIAHTNLWDRDRDGVGDACDGDDDGDGFPDATDRCPACSSTTDPDSDGDTFGNACDNCPNQFNAPFFGTRRQPDTDMDGQGDRCDTDDDNDGIADGSDNCPLSPNAAGPGGTPAAQVDSDHDGAGDACDSCTDVDGDGACTQCAPPGRYDCDPDCAPSDPRTRYAPLEVNGVRVTSVDEYKATLEWESLAPQAGTSVVYDILFGTLSSLRQNLGLYEAQCEREDFPFTSADIYHQDPVSGNGFWYLVRGYNSCGSGAYGPAGSNRDAQIASSPTRCAP